jgi:hypothetical protein
MGGKRQEEGERAKVESEGAWVWSLYECVKIGWWNPLDIVKRGEERGDKRVMEWIWSKYIIYM